eukprot:222198-Prymnesium_polylepis.1
MHHAAQSPRPRAAHHGQPGQFAQVVLPRQLISSWHGHPNTCPTPCRTSMPPAAISLSPPCLSSSPAERVKGGRYKSGGDTGGDTGGNSA